MNCNFELAEEVTALRLVTAIQIRLSQQLRVITCELGLKTRDKPEMSRYLGIK